MTENENSRTCANCACSYLMKHPSEINRTQRICRLQPPTTLIQNQRVQTQAGPQMVQVAALTQQMVTDDTVCWQWRREGTPPGDKNNDTEINSMLDAVGKYVESLLPDFVASKQKKN